MSSANALNLSEIIASEMSIYHPKIVEKVTDLTLSILAMLEMLDIKKMSDEQLVYQINMFLDHRLDPSVDDQIVVNGYKMIRNSVFAFVMMKLSSPTEEHKSLPVAKDVHEVKPAPVDNFTSVTSGKKSKKSKAKTIIEEKVDSVVDKSKQEFHEEKPMISNSMGDLQSNAMFRYLQKNSRSLGSFLNQNDQDKFMSGPPGLSLISKKSPERVFNDDFESSDSHMRAYSPPISGGKTYRSSLGNISTLTQYSAPISTKRMNTVSPTDSNEKEYKFDYRDAHKFNYVGENGYVEPSKVDEYLHNIGDSITFYTKGLNEEQVKTYLLSNFPRTEYFSKYTLDKKGENYFVVIGYSDPSPADTIKDIITQKTKERDYTDILTRNNYDDFIDSIEAVLPDLREKYYIGHKPIDDRLTSVRFTKKVSDKPFELPSKKVLANLFAKKGDNKVSIINLNNIPLSQYNKFAETGRIQGYKFNTPADNQPEDKRFRNVIVFSGDR